MIKEIIINESKDLGVWILNGTINASYTVCLMLGLISLILYLIGNKKFGKYIPASILLYYLMQCLRVVIK